jgi:DNA-binding transcriptional LysR family regulator
VVTLHYLKIFVAVAEEGGTAAAARALHLSQPSISLIIKNLEREFEAELFIRNPPKGLTLTPFGRSKLEQARTLLSMAEMISEPQDAGVQLRGEISIGYFSTLGPSYMPRLIRHLKDTLPKVEINLREGDLSLVNRMLDTGQVELAITYDLGMSERSLVYPLKESPFYAVLPALHPLAQQDTVSLKELAEENFIQIDLPYSREFLMSPFWHYQLEPTIAYKTTSFEMVRGMVANGLGVSVLITNPASDLAYDGSRIISLPISDPLPMQKLVLAQSHRLSATPIATAVIKEIVSLFDDTNSGN